MQRYIKELVKQFVLFSSKASFVFVLIFILLWVGVGFWQNSLYGLNEPHLFSIEGTAKREVKPDIVYITVGSYLNGTDPVKLQKMANTKISAAIEKIKQLGIDEDQIRTSGYNVSPQYDYEKNKITSYSVNVELEVTIKGVTTEDTLPGDVIASAAGNGLNEVRSLYFDIEQRDEIIEELRLEAIEKAKSKRAGIEEASGIRLGELKDVSYNGYNPYYYDDYYGRDTSAPESQPGVGYDEGENIGNVDINPGLTELSATVTLVYEIL